MSWPTHLFHSGADCRTRRPLTRAGRPSGWRDDEHPQADRRVGVRLSDPAGRGVGCDREGPCPARQLLHRARREPRCVDWFRAGRDRRSEGRRSGDRGADAGAVRRRPASPGGAAAAAAARPGPDRPGLSGGDPAGRAVQDLQPTTSRRFGSRSPSGSPQLNAADGPAQRLAGATQRTGPDTHRGGDASSSPPSTAGHRRMPGNSPP